MYCPEKLPEERVTGSVCPLRLKSTVAVEGLTERDTVPHGAVTVWCVLLVPGNWYSFP